MHISMKLRQIHGFQISFIHVSIYILCFSCCNVSKYLLSKYCKLTSALRCEVTDPPAEKEPSFLTTADDGSEKSTTFNYLRTCCLPADLHHRDPGHAAGARPAEAAELGHAHRGAVPSQHGDA